MCYYYDIWYSFFRTFSGSVSGSLMQHPLKVEHAMIYTEEKKHYLIHPTLKIFAVKVQWKNCILYPTLFNYILSILKSINAKIEKKVVKFSFYCNPNIDWKVCYKSCFNRVIFKCMYL